MCLAEEIASHENSKHYLFYFTLCCSLNSIAQQWNHMDFYLTGENIRALRLNNLIKFTTEEAIEPSDKHIPF